MTRISERSVLFADLRGSTSLYERLGNAEATSVVTHTVNALGKAVTQCGGDVVKTLGDGLMAVFSTPQAGLRAADAMHEALDRLVSRGSEHGASAGLRALRLQVALARGEVVEMAGDCYGDAVNVAARLLDHAGDNETLATARILEGLGEWERSRFRSLDKLQLRGRAEPVHVFLQEPLRSFGDTAATAYGDVEAPAVEPECIRLIWLDVDRVYAGASMPVILGRSLQATYTIDDNRVSRSHARIDWHGGTFQLIDLSYNGTYVRFNHDPELISLRRGACTLHGSGLIGLGTPPTDALSPSVRFEVLRFADTRREPLSKPVRRP